MMRLTSLRLSNYRRFDAFELAFDPELTVLVARNGLGKTTVLEAIATALGPFVGAFDLGQNKSIQRSDARAFRTGSGFEQEQAFPVVIEASLSEPELTWQRRLNGPKSRTTTREATPLSRWGEQLQQALRDGSEVALPVVAYYSSQRLWLNQTGPGKRLKGALLTQSRSAGYEECLVDRSSHGHLETWMRQATLRVLQSRDLPQGEDVHLQACMKGVSQAVESVLAHEGWGHLHYSMALMELALVHADCGELPVRLLSDGVRTMATLAGDIALRCVRLNPHLNEQASKLTEGVVLIDEVDLHLHPSWQQQVLSSLRAAFPKVQFIVTTHSAQVLSTVRRRNIRLIFKDGERAWRSFVPQRETIGMDSHGLMSEIMGVDPIPPVAEAQLLSEYMMRIEQGSHESEEGRALRQKLSDLYEQDHPIMRRLLRLIRLQGFKLKEG